MDPQRLETAMAGRPLRRIWFDALLLAAMALALYLGRSWYITYPLALNPDEAQVGANVLRLVRSGLGWDAMDGASTGPLNTLVAAWPHLLGLDATFGLMRVTAWGLLTITLAAVYATLVVLCGRFHAVAFTVPLAAFYALNASSEFQHYSSELLPLVLLTVPVALLACMETGRGPRRLLLAGIGFLLGCVPFAKLQGAPLAVTIGVFALFAVLRRSRDLRDVLALALPALLPATLLVAPMALSGQFEVFWNRYVVWSLLYVKPALTQVHLEELFREDPLLLAIVHLAVFAAGLALVFGPLRVLGANRFWTCLFLAIVAVAAYAVLRPGNLFPHYAMFLAPFLLLAAGWLSASARPAGALRVAYLAVVAAAVGWFLLPVASRLEHADLRPAVAFDTRSPRLLDPLGLRPEDALLVWGWMPQWHVWAGAQPAAREATSFNEVKATPLQSYFQAAMLSDVQASRPAMVIDSVAGKSFQFNDPRDFGLAKMPALASLLEREYVQARGLGTRKGCATVYLRKDRHEEARARRVVFRSLAASASMPGAYAPAHLDDLGVTEDTCTDFWLLPDRTLGSVHATFEGPATVREVLLLNTRNGKELDRGTGRVRVVLLHAGAEVFAREGEMAPHPRWTRFQLPSPVIADALRVDIQSYVGRGGGLNEIKVSGGAAPD